ncbi:hypothetical protein [Bradyrhizobium arachidis]|nr:hypothetical protein [Bradyrhizobium arachidis]
MTSRRAVREGGIEALVASGMEVDAADLLALLTRLVRLKAPESA